MQPTKKRIVWIDQLRAVAFYFVIVGHMKISSVFKSWIYSFHMPLFFFISGFTLNTDKLYETPFLSHLKKLFTRCIIPYFWIEFMCLCLSYLLDDIIKHKELNIPKAIIGILVSNNSVPKVVANPSKPLYFALVLFLAELCIWVITKVSKNNKGIMFLICCAFACISIVTKGKPMPWRLDAVPAATFFIFVGTIMIDIYKRNKEKIMSLKMQYYIPICAAFALAGYILWRFNGRLSLSSNKYGKDFMMCTLCAISTSLAIIMIMIKAPKSKILTIIGQNTFFYMGFHEPVIFIFNALFEQHMYKPWFIILVSTAIFICFVPFAVLARKTIPFAVGLPVKKDTKPILAGKFVSIVASSCIIFNYILDHAFGGIIKSNIILLLACIIIYLAVCFAVFLLFQNVIPLAFIQDKQSAQKIIPWKSNFGN